MQQGTPINTNPLDQLKDIQLPQESLWWPPSWVLIFTTIISIGLIIAGIGFAIYYWRKQAIKRQALKQLEKISNATSDDKALLDSIAELLRRYSISKDASLAGISMQNWQQHLAQHMNSKQAQLLAISRYQKSIDINRKDLIDAARNYIKKLKIKTQEASNV